MDHPTPVFIFVEDGLLYIYVIGLDHLFLALMV